MLSDIVKHFVRYCLTFCQTLSNILSDRYCQTFCQTLSSSLLDIVKHFVRHFQTLVNILSGIAKHFVRHCRKILSDIVKNFALHSQKLPNMTFYNQDLFYLQFEVSVDEVNQEGMYILSFHNCHNVDNKNRDASVNITVRILKTSCLI